MSWAAPRRLSPIRQFSTRLYFLHRISTRSFAPLGVCGWPNENSPVVQAVEIPLGTDTRPIALRKIVMKVPINKTIGRVAVGWLCVPQSDMKMDRGRKTLELDYFDDVFRKELKKNNYNVVGNPDALFEDRSLDKADFFVAGLIKDFEYSVCYPLAALGNYTSSTAAAYLKVQWQLYDTLNRRIVLTINSEGSYKVADSRADGLSVALGTAFANTVRSLLGNNKFKDLLTGKVKTAKLFEGSEIAIKICSLR